MDDIEIDVDNTMNEEKKESLLLSVKTLLRWFFYAFGVLGWALHTWYIFMAFYDSTNNGIFCLKYNDYGEMMTELFLIPLLLFFMILYVIVDIRERNKKENN